MDEQPPNEVAGHGAGLRFVELHGRSAFSFLRGGSSPESLAKAAVDAGLPAMALCDRHGLYGAVRFHRAAREFGLRALVGCELSMEDGSILPVLVESREGYTCLCRLLTNSHLRAEKGQGRLAWTELEETEGLIALTGDEEGPLARAWRAGGRPALEEVLGSLRRAFPGDRLFVEVWRDGLRQTRVLETVLRDVGASCGIPLVASNSPLHAAWDDHRVCDFFTCLRHHTTLDRAGALLLPNGERRVKGPPALEALFPDDRAAVARTVEVADRLEFTLGNLGYEFPRYPVPEGESMHSFLTKITWFGAEHRFGGLSPEVKAQIRRELDLIGRLGFSGYFLIVWDIVNFCRQQGIMVQGRGSAANSAVCYSLGITAVDPVGGRLLFERFLSEGRKSWPDIDLDLPSGERRERVIQEVYRRYAPRGAAMTANVITYRGRGALREIGKVLDFPEEWCSRFSKVQGHGDTPDLPTLKARLQQSGFPHHHPRLPALIDLHSRVCGLPRHLGQHSGGMIIAQGSLDSCVPLENATMPGRVVAQWDKDDCEDLGIIKVDLLGLGMMAVLQESLELARERGRGVDLARIPKDDPATYDAICAADTVGVFQIESRAQMATLPRMRPRTFYDLVVEVAIIRPGPIQGNLVHPYLERRAGRAPVDCFAPQLEPVLGRTLGVPLFQEQVLKMAMVMADFSGSEAEELRRALSFHRSTEQMDRVQVKLRRALEAKGTAPDLTDRIVNSIRSFALYGFPESHAISFALLAYASAYLKVHRAVEFYTALLNNQPMGFYGPSTLLQDARRHGIVALPPDVNHSNWECLVVDDHTLRLGILQVRGIRHQAVLQMQQTRAQGGPFRDLHDFRQRTGWTLPEERALARVGALDGLAGGRREALWQVAAPAAAWDWCTPGEDPQFPPMTDLEQMQADYMGLGLSPSMHPMSLARDGLVGLDRACDLGRRRHGEWACTGGAVICRQRPGTAKGFVFISLEDETGVANVVVAPRLFEKERLRITQEPFLRVEGWVQNRDGVVHLKAVRLRPLALPQLPPVGSHDFH